MQHEITAELPLLGDDGNIIEAGFAKKPLWKYDRNKIKAKKSRIKEWDYYYISDVDLALCLTVADMGYVGGLSISVIDFKKPSHFTNSSIFLFPMGKLKMPPTSEYGDVYRKNRGVEMKIENDGATRHITGVYPDADKKGADVTFDITLDRFPEESMVIATPFFKDKYFYYNQKINCMRAQGRVRVGDVTHDFDPENSLATLDWGRGVWTYDNTWYWSSLQTRLKDGSTFGWNLGYGFGNTEAASEDMLFLNGKAHKIGRTEFIIPDKDGAPDFMGEWKIVSDDGRLDCVFKPIVDRYEPLDLKVMCMIPHQVFGYAYGVCKTDDGAAIELEKVLCFAEKVHNKW